MDQLAESAMFFNGVGERKVPLHGVYIAPAFLGHDDVATGSQIIDDSLYGAFGDADFVGDFAHSDVSSASYQENNVGVVA